MDEVRTTTFEEIKTFHKQVMKTPYIIRRGNKFYNGDEEGFNHYRMQIPKSTRNIYRGGVCWDLCIFQSFWFKLHDTTIRTEFYYHELVFDENTCPSHTFMIFQYQGNWYWFEASWKPKAGIYRFKTREEAIGYVVHLLETEAIKKHKKKPIERWFTDYEPLNPKYNGMGVFEFMEEMRNCYQLKVPKYHGTQPVMESVHTGYEVLMNPEDRIEQIKFIKGRSGLQNSIVRVEGYPGWCRGRSEVLVINDKSVFLGFKKNGDYKIPGGGWEPNEPHSLAGIRETQEEARINVGDPIYILTYMDSFDEPHDWVKKEIPKPYWWYNYFTEVYVAEYLDKFTGHVDKLDQDSLERKGKFYPIAEVFPKLKKHHQDAIVAYFRTKRPVIGN